jgi:hypothetical protein
MTAPSVSPAGLETVLQHRPVGCQRRDRAVRQQPFERRPDTARLARLEGPRTRHDARLKTQQPWSLRRIHV